MQSSDAVYPSLAHPLDEVDEVGIAKFFQVTAQTVTFQRDFERL